MRRRPVALAGLILLAMLLRVGAILLTRGWAAPAEENSLIARNLRAGHGFTFTEFGVTGPTAVRGPAYPMLLAVLGPDRVKLILAINVLAGAASVVLAFTLAASFSSPPPLAGGGGGRGSADADSRSTLENPYPYPLPQGEGEPRDAVLGWIVAPALAVWPSQLYAATLTQGLPIAVMLTLATLALLRRETPAAALAAGAVAALAALTEPVLALPLLLLVLAVVGRGRAAHAAIYLATTVVLLAPWLYRNSIVFGHAMPLTSNAATDLFLGNGAHATGNRYARLLVNDAGEADKKQTRIDLLSSAEFDQLKAPEPQRMRLLQKWAVDWIVQHPKDYLKLCLNRAVDAVFGQYGHPLTNDIFFHFLLPVFTAGGLVMTALPWFDPTLRKICLALSLGLLLPMVLILTDVRCVVLLDVPFLFAWSALTARSIEQRRATA